MDISILFFTFYSLFVFQLTSTNDDMTFDFYSIYFFYLLFITLYCFFFFTHSLSLSLSPLATYRFPKFDDDSLALNMHY